jgi:hypothetical protein
MDGTWIGPEYQVYAAQVDNLQPGTAFKLVHHFVHGVVVFGLEFFSVGKVEVARGIG